MNLEIIKPVPVFAGDTAGKDAPFQCVHPEFMIPLVMDRAPLTGRGGRFVLGEMNTASGYLSCIFCCTLGTAYLALEINKVPPPRSFQILYIKGGIGPAGKPRISFFAAT
jgi:hypothetical protein